MTRHLPGSSLNDATCSRSSLLKNRASAVMRYNLLKLRVNLVWGGSAPFPPFRCTMQQDPCGSLYFLLFQVVGNHCNGGRQSLQDATCGGRGRGRETSFPLPPGEGQGKGRAPPEALSLQPCPSKQGRWIIGVRLNQLLQRVCPHKRQRNGRGLPLGITLLKHRYRHSGMLSAGTQHVKASWIPA